jgi:large subunit ribosomal protein L37Ae
MAETKKTITRFGSRYGRTTRERLASIEATYKGKHSCPHCAYKNVKRVAAGIWQCGKCNAKFTSRAYELTVPTAIKSTEPIATEEQDV